MPFTQQQMLAITQALTAKVPNACPMCGKRLLTITPEVVMFTMQPEPMKGISLAGKSLPCIVVACRTCGHMMFHNVFLLGVAEILGLKADVPEGGQNG